MGVMTWDSSLLPAVLMTRTASVTGQKPTSVHTTFTIAVSAKAEASGDSGKCKVIQGGFTSGRSGKGKASTSTKRWENQRQWKQSLRTPTCRTPKVFASRQK